MESYHLNLARLILDDLCLFKTKKNRQVHSQTGHVAIADDPDSALGSVSERKLEEKSHRFDVGISVQPFAMSVLKGDLVD